MKKALQRGFNLVEMSVILAVVGLILGAALVPVQSLFVDDIYEKEEQRLNEIKAAVMGYAVRNKSSFADTIFSSVGAGNAQERRFLIPGGNLMPEGRPYLPCPDITGDGYEDRFSTDITGFQFPSGEALQAAVRIIRDILDNGGDVIRSIGGCYASRGVLPWRTLGVPPADHWGNLYTYQVDTPFASALTGFNQNNEIDEYDWLRAVGQASGARIRRELGGPLVLTLTVFGLQTENGYRPPVVCGAPPCGPGLTLGLAAGKQADASFNLLFKAFSNGDIVEGVPFVIVSHGKNGAGAVNYARNVADKRAATPEAPVGFICNEPIDGTGEQSMAELISPEAHNFPSVSPRVHNGIQCRESQVMGSPDTDTSDGFIFHTTRNDDFDDIVVWATREELFDALRRGGVLDAPDLPAFRAFPVPSQP